MAQPTGPANLLQFSPVGSGVVGCAISCGAYQLYSLSNATFNPVWGCWKILEQVVKSTPKCAFIIFSDADKLKNGITLAKYIQDNNLGNITETVERQNPNSGNTIRIWIWEHDMAALKLFVAAKGAEFQLMQKQYQKDLSALNQKYAFSDLVSAPSV